MAVKGTAGKLLEYIFDRKGGQSRQPLRFIHRLPPSLPRGSSGRRPWERKVKGKLFGNLLRYLLNSISPERFSGDELFSASFLFNYFIPVLGKIFS